MPRKQDLTSDHAAPPDHAAAMPPGGDGLSLTERDQIRRRARAIWREEGCPQGRDREHWERAELEVLKARAPH